MKRIATAAALAIALVPCTTAFAATALSGTYNATIAGSGSLNGSWSLTFSGSKYTISFKGSTAVNGTLTQSGNKITFADKSGKYACSAKGIYSYTLSGRTLRFTRVSDSKCAGRRTVFAATYTKKFTSTGGSGY